MSHGTSARGIVKPIDVIIPCAYKDMETLPLCITGVKKYGEGVRRVIVISKDCLTDQAEWVNEGKFSFTKEDVARAIFENENDASAFLKSPRTRIGWIFQQLLKLYAFNTIPDLLDDVLILDADTIFINPTRFFDGEGKPIYNINKEIYPAYMPHAKRLLPSLELSETSNSGIAHCMLFHRSVMAAIFGEIEACHGKELWRAFCQCIDLHYVYNSCASEYEIYYHYLLTKKIPISHKHLRWRDISHLGALSRYKRLQFNFVSCHAYLREERLMKNLLRDV